MGVAVVGWALVPVPALPPPPSPLQGSSRARSRLEPGVERCTPLPLARPAKNSARGRGVEGGVISSQYQTRPYPVEPQKVGGLDGSGKG